MTYISILDYSTGNSLIIEDEDDLTKSLQNEDIEVLLDTLGHHPSNTSFMVTDEDPRGQRVTLRELADDNFDRIEQTCLKRLKGAEQ